MDLLSVMDRGFVFMLIQNYCKQMNGKIALLPDAAPLINLKVPGGVARVLLPRALSCLINTERVIS